ncbi:GNAT family N-acetyltransferase [Dactylosporangium cerinum]|uniref:GNAT family N-acetyltransferase n=1 Tax=Dactylosporangium cerinum TaxID=1434730 RepID=A0ABV9W0R0_9ACTN
MRWCREFAADVGEAVTIDAASWADTRFAEKRCTFWEAPDGTPVSMAGVNPMVAGQVRVDPVYTPAHLRGHGYAGAVTAEVSRAALAEGATDIVLFTNAANPTSSALYQRIGFVPIADWAAYDFTPTEPEASQDDRCHGPESSQDVQSPPPHSHADRTGSLHHRPTDRRRHPAACGTTSLRSPRVDFDR